MILITGPGRSGTTFLVMLLTRLGFDTGYEPYHEPYNSQIRAGCEQRLVFDWEWPDEYLREKFKVLPHVVKGPDWSWVIKELHKRNIVEFEVVLMPLREVMAATHSRIAEGLYWNALVTKDKERQFIDQATIKQVATGAVVEACVINDIPLVTMHFPRIVQNAQYLYDKLKEAGLEWRGEWETFKTVFEKTARPEQVHEWPT